jgi:hypothetical protein
MRLCRWECTGASDAAAESLMTYEIGSLMYTELDRERYRGIGPDRANAASAGAVYLRLPVDQNPVQLDEKSAGLRLARLTRGRAAAPVAALDSVAAGATSGTRPQLVGP